MSIAGVSKLPRVLYHYTTGDGLLSMLRSGHLWASDAAYMNDPRELRYGFDLLAEVASSEAKLRRTALLKDLLAQIGGVIQDKLVNGRIYLASFCESGDLLSQWRAYGAFGGGYAMGFSAACLYGRATEEREPVRVLRPVIYQRDRQVEALKHWLREYIRQGRSARDEAGYMALLWLFSNQLMTFKHPSYQEEHEWRLIQFGRYVGVNRRRLVGGKIIWPASFRTRAGQIVPYADLDLTRSGRPLKGKLPIVEIVCGPTVRRELGLKGLGQLCESLGFDCRVPDQAPPPARRGHPLLTLRLSAAPFVA